MQLRLIIKTVIGKSGISLSNDCFFKATSDSKLQFNKNPTIGLKPKVSEKRSILLYH